MIMKVGPAGCFCYHKLEQLGVSTGPLHDFRNVPGQLTFEVCRQPGTPWSCCPRSALARTIAKARAQEGLDLQAGFETEFYLGKPAPAAKQLEQIHIPVDASLFCDSAAFDAMAPGTFWLSLAALLYPKIFLRACTAPGASISVCRSLHGSAFV